MIQLPVWLDFCSLFFKIEPYRWQENTSDDWSWCRIKIRCCALSPPFLFCVRSRGLTKTCVLFPRLKSLTTETSVIVAALQKSKTGLLEISEDKTKVRRSPDKPLPEVNDEYKDTLKHKSVYIVSFCFFWLHPNSEFEFTLQYIYLGN